MPLSEKVHVLVYKFWNLFILLQILFIDTVWVLIYKVSKAYKYFYEYLKGYILCFVSDKNSVLTLKPFTATVRES